MNHYQYTAPEMSCVALDIAHLVAQALAGNHSDLITDALVGLEVKGELWVVTLNDDLGGLLHGLGADATHFGGCGEGSEGVCGGLVLPYNQKQNFKLRFRSVKWSRKPRLCGRSRA